MNVCVYMHTCVITVLDQALANYGTWDKHGLPPVFVNSFLGHRYTDSFIYFLRLFLCYNRPKSQKYLPSSTLQKKFVDPCTGQ